MNRLVENSPDFRSFISGVEEDIKVANVKSKYDEVYEDAQFALAVRSKC